MDDESEAVEVELKETEVTVAEEPEVTSGEEYILDDHRDLPHAIGWTGAFFHLLKGAVGTGILAIPWAFKRAGTMGGFLATCFLGILAGYSHYQLVNCAQHLCVKLRVPYLEYPDIAEQCFRLAPERFQKYAMASRYAVNFFLLFNMLGTCSVYLVFAAQHYKQCFDEYTGSNLDERVYIFILTIFLVFFNFIRNLNVLAPFSGLAFVMETIGLIITIYYCVQDLPPFDARPAFVSDFEKFALFTGTVIFAIQAVSLVNAIESEMRHPRQMISFPCGVVFPGMTIITLYTSVMGFIGYWKYDDPEGSMILNLPIKEPAAQAAKLLYGSGIFLSHVLFFYVPFNIIWPTMQKSKCVKSNEKQIVEWEYFFRAVWVLFTGGVAIGLPLLGALISIVGSVALASVTYVFPPLFNLMTFWDQQKYDPSVKKALRIKDLILISIGMVLFLSGTYASVVNLISEFQDK